MSVKGIVRRAIGSMLGLAFACAAVAQSYPSRPVKIITPFSAGAGPDAVLRLMADRLGKAWGQPVMVDNRPGASGILAAEAAKRSPADGYTLIQMDSAQLTALPHLMRKLPYDVKKDFEPVATQYQLFFFVAVPESSPWKSMRDLVAAATQSGTATYGSWYVGSPGHIGGAQLEAITGAKMLHVPFKDMGQLYTAVSTNDVNWAFGSAGSTGQLQKAGKLRYLAVAAPRRMEGFENVPTVSEAGGPAGFEVGGWLAVLAPRGVPKEIVTKINQDISRTMIEPEVRERLKTFGFSPYTLSPEELAKRIEMDSVAQASVIRKAKITLD